ncbi:MAG: aldehyde dehydrogenase family protein [Myxococcota bacterium]|nr:aldehyde dehydrogenase family protein [Myxococcota bacterium]
MNFEVRSPGSGEVLLTRPFATAAESERVLALSEAAKAQWRGLSLERRLALVEKMVEHFSSREAQLGRELSEQMGRPLSQTAGEIRGFAHRAKTMMRLAPEALADEKVGDKQGFVRFIRHEPLGCVLVLAPWNYPYLCAVNAVVPALLAGNTVVLKHSDQTPLCAERLQESADAAGFPAGVFQTLHASHERVAKLVADHRVNFVAFTGSVEGGRAVHRAAAGHFKAVGLELGGKDPAYIRADADPVWAGANVAEGAFFNSGQSCCAIERVYVHESIYDAVLAAMVNEAKKLILGDPLLPDTTLGPMVRTEAADRLRGQIQEAVEAGARMLVDPEEFPASQAGTPYLAPQILVDVNHDMAIMRDESFGPVVGVMKVASDEEALALMNDSNYGLTASIWTEDLERAMELAESLETGTVFLNRCDYLDPELAWVGVKNSGRGCTLSRLGFGPMTRPKSFHFRIQH